MSQSIYIIDLGRLNLPNPATLPELWSMIEAANGQAAGASPKFSALARRLVQKFPSPDMFAPGDPDANDCVWLSSPVKEAGSVDTAVWNLELPKEQGMMVLSHLVKEGCEMGLTLLDDQIGLGFLSGGKVIPQERQEEWNEYQREAAQIRRPTKAGMRRQMQTLLTELLAEHGFVRAAGPDPKGVDGVYQRAVEEGSQFIKFWIRDYYDEFFCAISIAGRCPTLRRIHHAALGVEKSDHLPDYSFSLGSVDAQRRGDFPIETAEQIQELRFWLEHKAMPLLDRAKDIHGVNWLHNDAEAEFIGKYLRLEEYASLICAHLTGSSCFDALAEHFAKRAEGLTEAFPNRDTGRPEHLVQLLHYLREQVQPLPPR